MGFLLSKLWTPPGYDLPDGATGLTPRQKDAVRNTWKVVRADTKKNGIDIFVRFFETYPDYQKLFKAFADVPLSELSRNGKLLGHAMAVMYSLNSIVDNLNDTECLVEILHKVGVSHRPRNISSQHFQDLSTFLITFLKDTVGPNLMDQAAEEAWKKALDVAMGIVVKALEESQ